MPRKATTDVKIKDTKALDKRLDEATKKLEEKLYGKDGKRHIVICGGTGCLSSNSQLIHDELLKEIKAHKLEDKVSVNLVGCFGFC